MYEATPPLAIHKAPFEDATQEKLRNRYPLKTIMEQNPNTYKGIRFTTQAKITSINPNKEWYYESCHQCSKKTTAQLNNYTCLDHGPQPGPFFRYKFKGYITDSSATVPLTFFSPAADKITGHRCLNLVEKYQPRDPTKVPPEVLATEGKTYVFQFHLNTMGNMTGLTLDDVFDITNGDESASSSSHKTISGTPPPTPTITTHPTNKEDQDDREISQSAKRALFQQPSTEAKKPKKD